MSEVTLKFSDSNLKICFFIPTKKEPKKNFLDCFVQKTPQKGISEEAAKKRTRKTVKHQRAIVGASLELIKERRSQKPSDRKAARDSKLAKDKEAKKLLKLPEKLKRLRLLLPVLLLFLKQQAKGSFFQKVKATSR